MYIIVADSASPDGTGQLVIDNFRNNSNVILLDSGLQRGRGASIVYTYQWIIDNKVPCLVVATSDADFSHDPKDFHRLFTALKKVDVVIGSRYLSTSKIVGWSVKRRVFSYMANVLARNLLRVGITDYTNGYRLFRRSMLTKLDFSTIDADGFIHLSQELLQWRKLNASISEVPTTFVNRTRDASNLKPKLIFESLAVIFKLAWQRHVSGK